MDCFKQDFQAAGVKKIGNFVKCRTWNFDGEVIVHPEGSYSWFKSIGDRVARRHRPDLCRYHYFGPRFHLFGSDYIYENYHVKPFFNTVTKSFIIIYRLRGCPFSTSKKFRIKNGVDYELYVKDGELAISPIGNKTRR